MLNWIDIETTGLDPNTGHMLEIGLIVTDDHLVEKHRSSCLIDSPLAMPELQGECSDFVRDMHISNGLWAELSREDGDVIAVVEHDLLGRIDEGGLLCGNSVHFDRAWMRVHMPLLEDALHYRNVDVSTVKELYKRFCVSSETFHKGLGIHRVLADLDASIAELKFYLGKMGWADLC